MLYSDLLDDPLLFDACASFDGGVVSVKRANLLASNQLAELINGDITRTGQIITRRGTRRLGPGPATGGSASPIQGLAFFGGALVAASGGGFYRFANDAWTTLPIPAVAGGGPVAFAQGADRLFFTDGTRALRAWDGTTCQDLGALSPDANLRPPVGGLLAWHASRLCVAGRADQPDAVSFSLPLAAGWDNAANTIRVGGGGEGGGIIALVPWSDFNLVVLKRHGAWVVNTAGAGPAGLFPVNAIHHRIGCAAARTAVQVGADVWFLSADGVRSVRRTRATLQQEVGDTLSLPIHDLIERINPAAVGTSCAAFWGNRYLLAVPLDGASAPNAVLVCDIPTRTWTGLWLGWRPLDWVVTAFEDDLRLCFGQVDGTVCEWLDYLPAEAETPAAFTDAGDVPIATTVRTRALTFGEARAPKTGFSYEAEFNHSEAAVTVRAILDDSAAPGADDTFGTGGAGRSLPLVLPGELARGGIARRALDLQRFGSFRELQFEVSSASGKLALRSIAASAFADAMVIFSAD